MVIKQTDDTTLAITHILYIQGKDIATKYIHAVYMTQ